MDLFLNLEDLQYVGHTGIDSTLEVQDSIWESRNPSTVWRSWQLHTIRSAGDLLELLITYIIFWEAWIRSFDCLADSMTKAGVPIWTHVDRKPAEQGEPLLSAGFMGFRKIVILYTIVPGVQSLCGPAATFRVIAMPALSTSTWPSGDKIIFYRAHPRRQHSSESVHKSCIRTSTRISVSEKPYPRLKYILYDLVHLHLCFTWKKHLWIYKEICCWKKEDNRPDIMNPTKRRISASKSSFDWEESPTITNTTAGSSLLTV